MKKKNFPPSRIRTPAARMLGVRSYHSTNLPLRKIPCKNHGCGQKKPGGTSSAIFWIETAAKYCELNNDNNNNYLYLYTVIISIN